MVSYFEIRHEYMAMTRDQLAMIYPYEDRSRRAARGGFHPDSLVRYGVIIGAEPASHNGGAKPDLIGHADRQQADDGLPDGAARCSYPWEDRKHQGRDAGAVRVRCEGR